MRTNYLAISWSTSRGRDTYGYNLCRLDSRATGARYRACGCGYDMVGTVLGDWLESEYQDKLRAFVAANADQLTDCGYSTAGYMRLPDHYGLTVRPDGRVVLDGGCGSDCIIRLAANLGISVAGDYNNRTRRYAGYMVTDYGSKAKMDAITLAA